MEEALYTALGLAVAPIIPAVSITAPESLSYGGHRIGVLIHLFPVVYVIAAAIIVLIGLPVFSLLRPFRPMQWWSILAVGFLLGALISIVQQLLGSRLDFSILLYGPLAALSALTLWLIWRRGVAS